MKRRVTDVFFSGVGGQGSVAVSHLLAEAALERGQAVRLTETYGAATRGGSVFSCVRIGEAYAPLPGENQAQAVVALEPLEGLRVALRFLAPGGWTLVNTKPWYPVDVSVGRVHYPEVAQLVAACRRLGGHALAFNATEMAQAAGDARMMNTILLGGLAALGIVDIDDDCVAEMMLRRWRKPVAEANAAAYRLGKRYVQERMAAPQEA